MLFALVVVRDLELDQIYVVTEFLCGDLDEDIYMEVPEGLRDRQNPNHRSKLLKSHCVLKQTPRLWYTKIHSSLTGLGLKSSYNDPCMYTLHTPSEIILIVLYVDELLIAGNKRAFIDQIKREFKTRFEIKDLGETKEILAIEFIQNRPNSSLSLHQAK